LEECEFSEDLSPKLEKAFEEEFAEELPTADAVLDTKALAKNEQKKKEKELICEVASLKEDAEYLDSYIEEIDEDLGALEEEFYGDDCDCCDCDDDDCDCGCCDDDDFIEVECPA
jgi:hypothetical protein